jgi:proteasome accessory factor B
MPDRITKTQRWLDLIALLIGRKVPVPVDEIMERVPAYAESGADGDDKARASARRMFERDKDELREMGIPIKMVAYHINYGMEEFQGYTIDRNDFYLPYLRVLAGERGAAPTSPPKEYGGLPGVELEPSEARLALDALRLAERLPAFPFADEARSAYRKITFDLDSERFDGAPVLWVERPGTREVLDRLRVISDALLARKRVTFTYHGIYRGAATERAVDPYGLFFQGDWYLVAHDPSKSALRVFRVSRMEKVVANTKSPKKRDYEIPDDFELRSYLGRKAFELGEEAITADVQFRFPAAIRAALSEEGELVEERADGSSVRRFAVSQVNPFLRWVLSFAGDAQILTPPELRDEYRAMAEQTLALYGGKRA